MTKTDRKGWSTKGQMGEEVVRLESGRGSVYIRTEDGKEGVTVAVDPSAAREVARQLLALATLAEVR